MFLGVQLYAFDKEYLLEQPDFIFRRLADIGYQGIEMPFMMDVRPYTREYNLQYSALHTGPDLLVDLPHVIDHLHSNHCHNLCVSGPLTWHDRSLKNFEKTCEFLNEKAKILSAEGINLHYHNHDFEFRSIPESKHKPIDVLLNRLDPALINLCVDTGWIHMVGLDSVSFQKEHKNRISYIHLRDFLNEQSVPLGKGDVDIINIVNSLKNNSQVEWVVVEHEPSNNALKELSASRNYLKEQLLI